MGQADELGMMAAAVENFKTAAIEKRRVDAEAEAGRSLLEAERASAKRMKPNNAPGGNGGRCSAAVWPSSRRRI